MTSWRAWAMPSMTMGPKVSIKAAAFQWAEITPGGMDPMIGLVIVGV